MSQTRTILRKRATLIMCHTQFDHVGLTVINEEDSYGGLNVLTPSPEEGGGGVAG